MQSKSQPFLLIFNQQKSNKVFNLGTKISQIIETARSTFNLQNDEILGLKFNEKIFDNVDMSLEEAGLKGKEKLELVSGNFLSREISVFLCFESDFHDWKALLSDRLIDIKRAFLESQSIDPSLYVVSIEDKLVDERLKLDEISNLDNLVLAFEKQKQAKSPKRQTLVTRGEIEEKEIHFRVSGHEVCELELNWFAEIRQLKLQVAHYLGFASKIVQRWYVNGKELDEESSLCKQLDLSQDPIIDIDRLTPLVFNISLQGKSTTKTLLVDTNKEISLIKQIIQLDVNIEPNNQIWFLNDSKDPLQENHILLNYTKDLADPIVHVRDKIVESANKPKSQTKKLYSFKFEANVVRKLYPIDEEIEVVIKGVQKSFQIDERVKVYLVSNSQLMDPKKSLADYNNEEIIVTLQENPINQMCVTFLFADQTKELSLNKKQTVKEIRDQACSLWKVGPPYLYSLFLDNQILKLFQMLSEIANFDESSVLGLFCAVEIKLYDQIDRQDFKTIIFNPNCTILELKKEISKIHFQDFELFFGNNLLEDHHLLKQYIYNDDEIKINIHEKNEKHLDVPVTFNLIPQNIEFQISIPKNGKIDDIKQYLCQKFKIEPLLQVWIYQGKKLQGQNELFDLLKLKGPSDLILIDFFEGILPYEQEIRLNKTIGNRSSIERIKVDLTAPLADIKKTVAQEWRLPMDIHQDWSIGSEKLKDHIPLVAQFQLFGREDIHVKMKNIKKVRFFITGQERVLSVDFDVPVKELKDYLFAEKYTSIKPNKQIWSFTSTMIKELDENWTLDTCFNGSENHNIWIIERNFKLYLHLKDIEENNIKRETLEEDPESQILSLKTIASSKFKLEASQQCWIIGNEELSDESQLKQYIQAGENELEIDVLIRKEFWVFIPELGKKLEAFPLNITIKKVKEKLKKDYPQINLENMGLEAYNQTLEDDYSLQNYMHLWKQEMRPFISLVKTATLAIIFGKRQEVINLHDQLTYSDIKDLLKEKFLLGDHEFELRDGNISIDEFEINNMLSNRVNKSLNCIKLKSIVLVYEDLNSKEDIMKIDSSNTIGYLRSKAANKLKIPDEYCNILMENLHLKTDNKSLDEINPNLSCFKLVVQVRKELEVRNNDKNYVVEYSPSEKVEEIKKRLEKKGFEDIHKFGLYFGENLLNDNQTLASYGILYGKHSLTLKLKKMVIVSIKNESKEYVASENTTVGDLKKLIEKSEGVNPSKQALILLKNEDWVRKLTNNNEKLQDLPTEDDGNVKIRLKISMSIPIVHSGDSTVKVFEGLAGAFVSEQKKMFELEFNIPRSNQIWSIGSINSLQIMDDNKSIDAYGIQGDNESNPVRIFRKIKLTVCLNEKNQILDEVPTYETVGDQKQKISRLLSISPKDQLWSRNEKELEDEKILEAYLSLEDSSDSNSYAVDLIVQNDLEYFGFTEKSPINPKLFINFYNESDEDLDKIIGDVGFIRKESSIQFRNKILGLFFATLKKHSMWENVINKIMKRTFDIKGVNLWKSNQKNKANQSKFNTQFLLHYFLNSGTPDLNVEIIKIIKMYFPIPLYINSWTNRFCIDGIKRVNDLFWVLQKSYVITSVGFGGAENRCCGKTELNNQILFSNFTKHFERNEICNNCPEILCDIYKNDKFPINLIDIPSGTRDYIRNQIITYSNMLIIHSLANQKETLEYVAQLPKQTPKIIFYRDVKEAFSYVGSFRESLLKSLNSAFNTNIFEVKITDLSSEDRSNELSEISGRVHEYILKKFQLTDDNDLWKFFNFFDDPNKKIHLILDRIKNNSGHLIKAIEAFSQLKTLEKNEKMDEQIKQDELTQLKLRLGQLSLAPEITELLTLLASSDGLSQGTDFETPSLFLEKLQEYLRMMKSQQTRIFYKLYEFKSNLSEFSHTNEEETIKELFKYWEDIKTQNNYLSDMLLEKDDANKQKIFEFIGKCITVFEQEIIPRIFSIELFWRELIYFTTLQPNYELNLNPNNQTQKIESLCLLDFLIQLKKESIFNGFPFEIIDGDLLYMPKEFFKKVFTGCNDRIIIISVLGPQSSGKSTLLNFLFGCNFITSSGRCTKGIYGTYFKVSNFNCCDGILVLDTEGLFGLLNKNEENNREKFDRKLVLFCLAMSDFVLINFKGDIDKNLADVLLICKDSLTKLQQGNIKIPEMFLILNQNTQTNINTQLQDINKMGDLGFSRANVEVLPLAFETNTIENPTIERYMDPLMKKTPKKDFSEKCRALTQKILDKIKSGLGNQRTLENIMDRMENLWELFNKFPDLLKFTKMQDFAQEKELKDWIHAEVDEKLKNKFSKMIDEFKVLPEIPSWEPSFLDMIIEEENKIRKDFTSSFQDKTSVSLFFDLENTLFTHLSRVKSDLHNDLNLQIQQKKQKIYDTRGNDLIREAASHVRNKLNMSEEDRNQHFENVWSKIINSLANSYDRKSESSNLFQIVKENYQTNLTVLQGILPTTSFTQDTTMTFENYQKYLFKSVKKDYEAEKSFEYTLNAPALIFKGGKGNIPFKYLDLKKYFEEEDVEQTIAIPKSTIYKLFDTSKLRQEFEGHFQKVEVSENIINDVYSQLKCLGVVIPENSIKIVLNKKKQSFWKLWKNIFAQEPIQANEIDSGSCCYQREVIENLMNLNPDCIEYINLDTLKKIYLQLQSNQITPKKFFNSILDICVNWAKIMEIIKKKAFDDYKSAKVSEIAKKINEDLRKINLKFVDENTIETTVLSMNSSDEKDYKEQLNESITEFNTKCCLNEYLDLSKQDFTYINPEALKGCWQILSEGYSKHYLVLTRWKGKKLVVKKEFEKIPWLVAYGKNESDKIFINTVQNKTLLNFVFKEFSFASLLKDIFETAILTMKNFDNWTYAELYQQITRNTNDLIGTANNDLQQVSYRLDFKLVGHIHLSVVYLLWKFYEENHWNKITEPFVIMEKKKDQQKEYFDALVVSNHAQINKAEAEKTRNHLQTYFMSQMLEFKKLKIIEMSRNFKDCVTRQKIQNAIDAKRFSLTSTKDNNDLYFYILNPHDELLKEYEEASNSDFTKFKTEVEQKKAKLGELLQAIFTKTNQLKTNLVCWGEDSWATHNIFEFIAYKEENEVLFKKYESELEELYYKIVLEMLKGDEKKLSEEYKINEHTRVIMKRNELQKIQSLENQELDAIFEDLASESRKVTNAFIFIENLSKQIQQLIAESDKLFETNPEDWKEYKDKINIFICKQRCPCCDRICGVDNPNHDYHECIFGHQIRAIGGVMMENKDASVARCEDIDDVDRMQYNGQEMTWMEFKDKMKKAANNPWKFEDLDKTRGNKLLKERFVLAWTLIGKRICEERYKDSGIKFIEYNQNNITMQKLHEKNYIFMIDSSGIGFF